MLFSREALVALSRPAVQVRVPRPVELPSIDSGVEQRPKKYIKRTDDLFEAFGLQRRFGHERAPLLVLDRIRRELLGERDRR
jgi:hypothetical protein